MRIESGKAHGRGRQWTSAQHRRSEIETRRQERCRRREVVGLLRLREDVRHVVALIAPSVQINGCVKDAISAAQDQPLSWKLFRNTEAWSEVYLAGIHEPFGIALLASDKHLRSSV